ncbi:MAG: hypothetical protein PHF00_11285 [Elusimicrobia bacterium]|nr:hypothetical protein [Elusimicrobiota bacterium]
MKYSLFGEIVSNLVARKARLRRRVLEVFEDTVVEGILSRWPGRRDLLVGLVAVALLGQETCRQSHESIDFEGSTQAA